MADRLFFQHLFTDNTKMPKKSGCRHSHYADRLRLKHFVVCVQHPQHYFLPAKFTLLGKHIYINFFYTILQLSIKLKKTMVCIVLLNKY